MNRVRREDLLDWQTYEDGRAAFRARVMAEKDRRRIHVGDVLTFLFENGLTMRYQVQEMMRAEKMVREKDIRHELDTYNGLLGGPGELAATLLIEIDDPAGRRDRLKDLLPLPDHLYVALEDGTRVRPVFDRSQVGDDKLSSVQYLKFPVGGKVPAAVGSDLPSLAAETRLTEDQRRALAEDLANGD
jgi:hypothetical protein